MYIAISHLLATQANIVPLALVYGAIALLGGVSSARGTTAVAVPPALEAATCVIDGLAPLVRVVSSGRLRSPWYDRLAAADRHHGVGLYSLVPGAMMIAAPVLRLLAFERRHLRM
jgi:hypothetical protein